MSPTFDTPIRTNAASLDKVLALRQPTLLILEMPNCAPCTSLDQPLKELARRFAGQVLIVRLENITEAGLQTRFNVSRVPSLLLLKDEHEISRMEGAPSAEVLTQALRYLAGQAPAFTPGSGPSQALGSASGSGESSSSRGAYQQPSASSAAKSQAAVEPLIVSDASFERDVLRAPLPVLVDFWAPWCGPCRMVSPIVEELGREYRGRLRVAKVNTDENPQRAGMLGIRGIPTLILFKGGREVDRIVGAAPKPQLMQMIERHLV